MDFQSKDKRPDCCSPCRTVRDAEAVQREHNYIHCLSHCWVQVHFGSQFEGIVHHGGDRMATKSQAAGHIASAVRSRGRWTVALSSLSLFHTVRSLWDDVTPIHSRPSLLS